MASAEPAPGRRPARRRAAPVEPLTRPGDVFVGRSPLHGVGVFAGRAFEAEEVIEVCPVLVVPAAEVGHLEQTSLYGYYFHWDEDGAGLALGYGSLYNHSWVPTARYEHDYDAGTVVYIALGPIRAGDEVTINYTGDPDGRDELWFNPGPPPPAASR
jgi:SET domain-containing protein